MLTKIYRQNSIKCMLEAITNNLRIRQKIFKDVEGLTNVEKMASGKKYLACQLGSRVGMLEKSCQILDSKKSPKFPKISQIHGD